MRPASAVNSESDGAKFKARMIEEGKCPRERSVLNSDASKSAGAVSQLVESSTQAGSPMTRLKNETTGQAVAGLSLLAMRDAYKAWCEHCCDVVFALAPESALQVMRITAQTFRELLAAGMLHAVEAGARSLLICCNSISSHNGCSGHCPRSNRATRNER